MIPCALTCLTSRPGIARVSTFGGGGAAGCAPAVPPPPRRPGAGGDVHPPAAPPTRSARRRAARARGRLSTTGERGRPANSCLVASHEPGVLAYANLRCRHTILLTRPTRSLYGSRAP